MKFILKVKKKKDNIVRLGLSDYFVLLFFLWGFGRLTRDIYRPILLVVAIIWIFLISPSIRKLFFIRDKAVVFYILFLVLYTIQVPFSVNPKTALSYLGVYTLYLIIILMFDYYVSFNKKQKLYRICNIILIWIVLLCCFAILYYIKYPGAARLHATHRSNLSGYMIGGGYQIAYVCALLLPYLLTRVLRKKTSIKAYITIVIMFVLLWKTTSVITMISAFVGCYIAFAFSGEKRRKIVYLISALIIIITFLFLRGNIGQFFIDLSGDRTVTSFANMNNATFVRLRELGLMLQGISSDTMVAFTLRFENFTRPLKDILKHPILGSLPFTGVNPEVSNFNDSSIITSLVCWGIPMGILYLYPVFKKIGEYKSYIGSAVAMLLMMLLNPSEGFSIYATSFFILPCLELMGKEEIKIFIE